MDYTYLTKLSDKVLAKFARRAATCRMVLPEEMRKQFDGFLPMVIGELNRRGVKWQGSAE